MSTDPQDHERARLEMNDTSKSMKDSDEPNGSVYSAPALEKGLDILELLCRSEVPLSQKEIAQQLRRSVSALYRMIASLVERGYIVNIDDKLYVTTKLFELAHINPPTQRLLTEAMPLMQKLSSDLDQACHLTVYSHGRQIVVSKVDAPSGMGFSVRVGAELDVVVSASGRVLLAFQDGETRQIRIEESLRRRPEHADPQIAATLDTIRARGFESIPSVQVRGLYAVSFPILDSQRHAIAALTVPYAERIDKVDRKSIAIVEETLGATAQTLSRRMGGAG
ncbi:MAG: IclR family transcriptional regulator [Xanthobacteraceae bacterium]|nr:IclR family transcriptional regulator [Xanthobacteraceae bacterium]